MDRYEQASRKHKETQEWLSTPEGNKDFADMIVTSAFVAYGEKAEDAQKVMRSCGKALSMCHPQAVFHAFCEHAHNGIGTAMHLMEEAGEGDEFDRQTQALHALKKTCEMMCKVCKATEYWNTKNVCKALANVPDAVHKQRTMDEAFGSENDGMYIGFNFLTGELLVKESSDENE